MEIGMIRRANQPKVMITRKAKRIAVVAAATLVLSIVAYYSLTVLEARDYTRNVIAKDLQSRSWRRPNGPAKGFTLDIADLTQRQIDVLLTVEDPAFFAHNGMDLKTPGAGITTITQGLVKILYFAHFKPGIRKLKQTLIAVFALDPLISKKNQLLLFINAVYLGRMDGKEVRGFEQAAQVYYGKSFTSLTEDEYLSLVAMIIGPNSFHVVRYPERNAERVRRIKRLISGEYKPTGLMDLFYDKR